MRGRANADLKLPVIQFSQRVQTSDIDDGTTQYLPVIFRNRYLTLYNILFKSCLVVLLPSSIKMMNLVLRIKRDLLSEKEIFNI